MPGKIFCVMLDSVMFFLFVLCKLFFKHQLLGSFLGLLESKIMFCDGFRSFFFPDEETRPAPSEPWPGLAEKMGPMRSRNEWKLS